MKILIIAAGHGKRWNQYLDVPKHLAPVEGEPILHRTINICYMLGFHDIHVLGPPDDSRYRNPRATLHIPEIDDSNGEADKFAVTIEHWSPTEPTLILYGDVYFDAGTLTRILTHKPDEFTLYARYGPSVSGSPWGECFAFNVPVNSHPRALSALEDCITAHRRGELQKNGGWRWYRRYIGLGMGQLNRHWIGPNFHEINNLTDDFDEPEDYDRLITALQERRKWEQPL